MNPMLPAHSGIPDVSVASLHPPTDRARSPRGRRLGRDAELMRRVATILMLCSLPACTRNVDPQAVTSGPEVEAVRTWLRDYLASINAGDLEGWLAFVADDAVIMPPDEVPIVGMDAIRPRYEVVYATWAFDFTARVGEIVVAGDLAVVRASFEETVTPRGAGAPIAFSGSWMMVLRRQADGSWKLWRNMWGIVPGTAATPP